MQSIAVVITGAAGYVGEMLCAQAAARPDIHAIIAIDKEPMTDFLRQVPKLTYVQANLADDTWQAPAAAAQPAVVVHAAWQIRSLYGRADEQWRLNITGSDQVFAFAFGTPSVTTLIHFSTAASYRDRKSVV